MNKAVPVKPLHLFGAVSLAIGCVATAHAQTAPTLEEVVVTAQKRTQSLQDVPIAITALGSEDLERLNAATLADIQYSTPNLTISPNARSNLRVGLRGVSDFSRNPGYDNRVSVYVDGIFVGRSAASNQATLDLERVEVLRGPQGTLFGKNTVAGAISLTSKKADDELRGFVMGKLGNYGYTSVTGMLNGALSDRLFAKVMVNDTQRDGHVDNLFDGSELNGLDDQSLRLQLRWQGDATDVNFALDQDKRGAPFHGREAANDRAAPEIYEVAFNAPSLQDIDLLGLSLTVDRELDNGMTLSSLTGYRETEFQNSADEDYSPLDVSTSALNETSDHFTQEFRLISAPNERFDYVAGLFYFEQSNQATSSATGGAFFPRPFTGVSVPASVDVTSWAAYVHGNYRISEKLELTGGLRYTWEEKEVDFVITDTTGLFSNGSYRDDRDAEDLSPKIGLNYFASDSTMLYANYARGFKSGGWNVDFISTFEQIAFDDELVDSYEIGMKTDFWDGRGRFNTAVFIAQYSDFQVFQFVPLANGGTISTITNAGEVTTQGIEVDLNIAVTDAITLWATYGYTDATFDSFKDGGGPGVDYDGNSLPDAPENTFSVGVEGRFPAAAGELVISFDYNYRDSFFTNPNNADATAVDAYEILNGRLGYEAQNGRWNAFLWARNLADSDDAIYASRAFLGINREVYLEPRMYGLTLQYNFGG
jgi:iron complex outermembrane receptor protein